MIRNPLGLSKKEFVPALVDVLKGGYSPAMFGKDALAGLTVGVIALPLAMAFAIGAGATPTQGLWTAVIAGFCVAALGGSRYQVTGPTGAFVVIIAGVIARHGMEGLVVATLIAGALLILLGATGLGKLVKYIPYPVTTGFTTGIGVIIFVGQLKDLFGLKVENPSPEFFEKIGELVEAAPSANPWAIGIGAAVILVIVLVRKLVPRLPGAIVAIALVTAAVAIFDLPVETVRSRFGEIAPGLPAIGLPRAFSWKLVQDVFPSAITIALLGAIESLLSAVVADGMTGDRHKASAELVAQGLGNVLSALAGGIPATGAIARTAANIKSGAVSPVSSITHALVLLAFALFLAPLAGMIPLAALAAVLVVVAWDMSELHRFLSMRKAPKSDFTVLLATFVLTVAIDLTVAVQVGVLLAVFLFVRRISETTTLEDLSDAFGEGAAAGELLASRMPARSEIYEINGPFFFGVADLLQDTLDGLERPPRVFVLVMRNVPAIDATGINALKAFAEHCGRKRTALVLACVRDAVLDKLEKAGFHGAPRENVVATVGLAIERARTIVEGKEAR